MSHLIFGWNLNCCIVQAESHVGFNKPKEFHSMEKTVGITKVWNLDYVSQLCGMNPKLVKFFYHLFEHYVCFQHLLFTTFFAPLD